MIQEKQLPYGCSPMDTQVFNQGLSVLATSAYIIIASLMGDGVRADPVAISARWNAAPADLESALAELQAKNIVERHPGFQDSGPLYIANPASLWTAGA